MVEKLKLVINVYVEDIRNSEEVIENPNVIVRYESIAESIISEVSSFRDYFGIINICQGNNGYAEIVLNKRNLADVKIILSIYEYTDTGITSPKIGRNENFYGKIIKNVYINSKSADSLTDVTNIIHDICNKMIEGDIHHLLDVDYSD